MQMSEAALKGRSEGEGPCPRARFSVTAACDGSVFSSCQVLGMPGAGADRSRDSGQSLLELKKRDGCTAMTAIPG